MHLNQPVHSVKRALLVAPYFLPRRRVGSMRPFRFAIHLRDFGWAPTVLTITAKGQHLTEKEARLLQDVEIVELEPPFDRTVRAESQLGLEPTAKARPSKSAGHRFIETLERQFPADTWLVLFWAKYRQLVETVRQVRPDVIWSTGDPWSSLVITEKLVRRFGIPWVADFRDPWTLCDVRTDGQWPLTKALDRRYEQRILETADVVLFQARQTEANYRQHYAGLDLRTTTIYNSYDPAVFDDPVDLAQATPFAVSTGEDLHLGFFGRFRAMSPASLIIDVLAEARRRHGTLADHIKVDSFGPLNEDDAHYAREQGVFGNFGQKDAVPLEKALSALRQFDILLLSTDPRRDEIIPAKLFEYLAAARPILSLSQNPEVADILQRTGAGIQPSLDNVPAIADMLVESLKARRANQPLPIPFDPRPAEIQRFEARATTEELAALFDAVLEGFPARSRESVASLR